MKCQILFSRIMSSACKMLTVIMNNAIKHKAMISCCLIKQLSLISHFSILKYKLSYLVQLVLGNSVGLVCIIIFFVKSWDIIQLLTFEVFDMT